MGVDRVFDGICVVVPVIVVCDARRIEVHVTDGKPLNELSNSKARVCSPLLSDGEFFLILRV